LFDDIVEAGKIYEITLSGYNLATGVYLYQLSGNNKIEIKKMTLIE
jgi:hypothetical protein